MPKKTSLVIYNANNPKELFTCLKVPDPGIDDSTVLNLDQMEIVKVTCHEGPYLAFYRSWPDRFFSLGYIYNEKGEPESVTVIQNCLLNDDKQRDIVATILGKITKQSIKNNKK